jgi:hypothetical protein
MIREPELGGLAAAGPESDEVGPFIVRGVGDLFHLMGGCCSARDVQILWRILDDEGRISHGDGYAVIDLPTYADLRARCLRARVAGRRERSTLGRFDDFD